MKDYIVLDDSDSSVQGDYLSWNIHPSAFTHWEHGDDVYIKLIQCSFYAPSDLPGASLTFSQAIIESNIVCQNQYNSSSAYTVLAIQPVTYQGDATSGAVFSSQSNSIPIKLKTDRFNNIKIKIRYLSSYIKLDDASAEFQAVFEVEYKGQKDHTNDLLKLISQNGSGSIRAGDIV